MGEIVAIATTQAARELIGQLRTEHGPLSLHVSGSYGVSVVCLMANELNLGVRDVLIGAIDDAKVFMMTSEINTWRGSTMVVDVARGVGVGFSLEASRGVHFTIRKRADPAKRTWDAEAILAAGPPPSPVSIKETDR